MAGLALTGSVGVAEAIPPTPHMRLHPIEGAHWQANAGFPDRTGDASQALVAGRSGEDAAHQGVAVITGLEGMSTAELQRLAFAFASDGAGRRPSVRLGYTAPDSPDREAEVVITADQMRATEIDGARGWTQFTWEGSLPEGEITSLEIGIDDPDSVDPPEPDRFDNVEVND